MSHSEQEIVCPNCSFTTTENYCARCGQKNNLHKDTSWGLVLHFFEHYLHYDNKFWKTMYALLFSPGKLTIAYWKNQRMRYISPMSLYIFISAVHFIVASFVFSVMEPKVYADFKKVRLVDKRYDNAKSGLNKNESKLDIALEKIQENPIIIKPIIDKVEQYTPRVFFFMVPFTALLLQLVFIRRKDLYFVDHVIFSLHCHSFYFFIGIISTLFQLIPALQLLSIAGMLLYVIYFIAAMSTAYKLSTGRAIGYSFIIGLTYVAVYLAIALCYIVYLWNGIYGGH